jgi:hypothetical protein
MTIKTVPLARLTLNSAAMTMLLKQWPRYSLYVESSSSLPSPSFYSHNLSNHLIFLFAQDKSHMQHRYIELFMDSTPGVGGSGGSGDRGGFGGGNNFNNRGDGFIKFSF